MTNWRLQISAGAIDGKGQEITYPGKPAREENSFLLSAAPSLCPSEACMENKIKIIPFETLSNIIDLSFVRVMKPE